MRQVANKAYRVRQHRLANVGDINTAQRWVQRRKQLVCRVNLRFGIWLNSVDFPALV